MLPVKRLLIPFPPASLSPHPSTCLQSSNVNRKFCVASKPFCMHIHNEKYLLRKFCLSCLSHSVVWVAGTFLKVTFLEQDSCRNVSVCCWHKVLFSQITADFNYHLTRAWAPDPPVCMWCPKEELNAWARKKTSKDKASMSLPGSVEGDQAGAHSTSLWLKHFSLILIHTGFQWFIVVTGRKPWDLAAPGAVGYADAERFHGVLLRSVWHGFSVRKACYSWKFAGCIIFWPCHFCS